MVEAVVDAVSVVVEAVVDAVSVKVKVLVDVALVVFIEEAVVVAGEVIVETEVGDSRVAKVTVDDGEEEGKEV